MSLQESLCNIIKEVLENDKINNNEIAEGSLISLGFNSISFIKMVIKIETEFDIQYDNDMLLIDKLNTLEYMYVQISNLG